MVSRISLHLPPFVARQHWLRGIVKSDTPGKAGGLMSGTASKAVGPSDGHRSHGGTVLRPARPPPWGVKPAPGYGELQRGSSAPPTVATASPRAQPCALVPMGGAKGTEMRCSYGVSPSHPRQEYSTPGTLKAVQVALVKPVAYLKD